jgi:hypothetical protein
MVKSLKILLDLVLRSKKHFLYKKGDIHKTKSIQTVVRNYTAV